MPACGCCSQNHRIQEKGVIELWDEPRPLTQSEWDQMLCELTLMGMLEEQFQTIMEQQDDEQHIP